MRTRAQPAVLGLGDERTRLVVGRSLRAVVASGVCSRLGRPLPLLVPIGSPGGLANSVSRRLPPQLSVLPPAGLLSRGGGAAVLVGRDARASTASLARAGLWCQKWLRLATFDTRPVARPAGCLHGLSPSSRFTDGNRHPDNTGPKPGRKPPIQSAISFPAMNTPNTTASAHTRGWFLTPATEQNAFLIVTGRGATGNAKTGKKRFLLERMHLGDEPVRCLKRILASE
ncbi:MAG TPA: hypothetical protein VEL76_23530, partial [Gemmataceae bacterium]|nr:hypothetical protein [Gemmataceae bacterium]